MRPPRLAALVVTLALALIGCSEAVQEAAERSSDPVVAAAARTADAGSARVAITVGAPGTPVHVTGEGVVDLADGEDGALTMEIPGGEGALQTVEVRVVDGTVYLRHPGTVARHPETPWVRVEPGEGADAAPDDPLQGLATQNPAEVVGLLESATDFTEAGTEAIRGAEVTVFRGHLDLAARTEGEDPAAAGKLRSLGLEQVPTEVAVDEEGRLRRLALTIDLAAVAGATAGSLPPGMPTEMTMSIELFDFGTPVDVEAPPPPEVTDAGSAAPPRT